MLATNITVGPVTNPSSMVTDCHAVNRVVAFPVKEVHQACATGN